MLSIGLGIGTIETTCCARVKRLKLVNTAEFALTRVFLSSLRFNAGRSGRSDDDR